MGEIVAVVEDSRLAEERQSCSLQHFVGIPMRKHGAVTPEPEVSPRASCLVFLEADLAYLLPLLEAVVWSRERHSLLWAGLRSGATFCRKRALPDTVVGEDILLGRTSTDCRTCRGERYHSDHPCRELEFRKL